MSYTITNIEYGIGPWGTEWLYGMVGNPKPGETEDNVHSVTLIQGEGRNILVDTGVDMDDPAKNNLWSSLIPVCHGVVWALEQAGVSPEDIDTVICTHAHLDHIGGVGRFPNAQIYIQKEEFETWETLAVRPEYNQIVLPAAFPPDYPVMRQMIDDGQVTLLCGDVKNFLPDIDLHVVRNCHSVAEQVVTVDDKGKKFVIAGDIACRPANLLGMGEWSGYLIPILGRSGSALNVMQAYDWVNEQIERDSSRLVLTHDVTMRDRFKSKDLGDGIAMHYVVE